MIDVLVALEVVEWLASDLHYNSTGPMFYALHLLADRVKDFGSAEDDLKEGYWLGCLDTTPPSDREIANAAISAYDKVVDGKDCPIARLLDGLTNLGVVVNELKNDWATPVDFTISIELPKRKNWLSVPCASFAELF